MSSKLIQEIQKRKTFGIISHPDAGKTTLTEKLLLFGGAIQTAGAVKSNKNARAALSDFMEIEKQRGISVATSVMGFEYKGVKINLLDKLVAQGIKSASILEREGKFSVCYGSFPTKAEANSKLSDAKSEFKSAWIFNKP